MRYFLQWSLVGKLMKSYSFQVVVEYIAIWFTSKDWNNAYVCAISTFHCQGYHKMTDSECPILLKV